MMIFLGLLAAAHLTGLVGCSKKSTPADTIPPGAPVLLPTPADSAWDETGTDAIPGEDWIQLVWLGQPEPDLEGYRIYRWTPPHEIPTLLDTKTLGTGDNDTTYKDTSVQIGVRYHYQVTALDRTGNESAKSDTADYMLIPKLSPENLIEPRGPDVEERQPTFSWISTGESLQNHLRVYDVLEEQTVWVSSGHNPFSSPHAVLYNDDGTAAQSLLIPGREYWWRVDRQGSALRSGSESNWVSFTVR
jgi:hypothetical protein